jgi:polyisoprenoid-binding protein YceI
MLHTRPLTVLLVSLISAPACAESYQLDPSRTVPRFEIDHLWLFTERGRFDRVQGTLEYDAEARTGSLQVVIDARSLNTGNDERDSVLAGADWFDVARFPAIIFRSQRFVFEQERLVAVEGELTMRGVARPLRLEVIEIRCPNPVSTASCVADARGTLHRSSYGMRTGLPFIGDEVRLRIEARTYREN